MAEKREEKRRLKRLRLKYGTDTPQRSAFTDDISPDGLFIRTVSPIFPGKKMRIDLDSPSGEIIRIEGCVMWIKRVPPSLIHLAKKGGMGVRITKMLSGEENYRELCAKRA